MMSTGSDISDLKTEILFFLSKRGMIQKVHNYFI